MAEEKPSLEVRAGPAIPVAEVAPVAIVPYWTYLIPIGIAAIGMIQVLGLAVIGYLMSGVKQDAAATAKSTEKIHVAVNNERTVMLEKLEALRAEILQLSTERARSQQKALDAKK